MLVLALFAVYNPFHLSISVNTSNRSILIIPNRSYLVIAWFRMELVTLQVCHLMTTNLLFIWREYVLCFIANKCWIAHWADISGKCLVLYKSAQIKLQFFFIFLFYKNSFPYLLLFLYPIFNKRKFRVESYNFIVTQIIATVKMAKDSKLHVNRSNPPLYAF